MVIANDPIKHVVLLMLENHSFDEMLGSFQEKYPELDGINTSQIPRFNEDKKGNKFYQKQKANYCVRFDPPHELEDIAVQLSEQNGGFIKSYISGYPKEKLTQEDLDNVMGYYARGFLPATHALAEDFMICDRWFSSVPASTWSNRLFVLSGTNSGYLTMPKGSDLALNTINAQTQSTIFDRLNEKNKSWKIYYYDLALSLLFKNQHKDENLRNYHTIDQFFNIDSKGLESNFPDFVFIEPKFYGIDQNDSHPTHNIMNAEKLISDVYNAIRSNKLLWETTLFIITYDEHGGFYDHVIPPKTIAPDNKLNEYTYDQLGLRVPTLLISPWVERGVNKTQYDHTSILKYLIEKWELGPLGARTEQANSIGNAILSTIRKDKDMISFTRVPLTELLKSKEYSNIMLKSCLHNSLQVLSSYIESELDNIKSSVLNNSIKTLSLFSTIKMNLAYKLGKFIQKFGIKLIKYSKRHEEVMMYNSVSMVNNIINKAKKNTKPL